MRTSARDIFLRATGCAAVMSIESQMLAPCGRTLGLSGANEQFDRFTKTLVFLKSRLNFPAAGGKSKRFLVLPPLNQLITRNDQCEEWRETSLSTTAASCQSGRPRLHNDFSNFERLPNPHVCGKEIEKAQLYKTAFPVT